ncbi:MAG: 3-dehydroquinate synthase [Candidatus Margulisiibacteriota bacterium]
MPITVTTATTTYPIHVGRGLLGKIPDWIRDQTKAKKIAVVTNPNIQVHATPLIQSLQEAGFDCLPILIPSGETAKCFEQLQHIVGLLAEHRFERGDAVVALGGGVIGDLAGFAASVYLRGIRLFQVPTTLLAQVDSAIGGKTGINIPHGKNLVGTFYQPTMTVCDLEVLKTLPSREWRCGLAEVVKYGVIFDADFFAWLQAHSEVIRTPNFDQNPEVWQHIVEQSAQIKAHVVSLDEKEAGLREILNFGHTIGHAIEAAFGYSVYLHGEAIAIGMKAAMRIAHRMHLIEEDACVRLENLLAELGFELTLKPIAVQALMTPLFQDKKVRQGKLRFVLPTQLGKVETRSDVPLSLIEAVIKELVCES